MSKKQNLFNNSIKDSKTCHPNKKKLTWNEFQIAEE